MTLFDPDRKFVDEFFAAVSPYEAAYRHVTFSYLAVKFGQQFLLVQGRIFMNTSPTAGGQQHFQAPHVRAGNYTLEELGFDVRGLID